MNDCWGRFSRIEPDRIVRENFDLTMSFAGIAADFESTPQAHWLDNLDRAERFHGWVIDKLGKLVGPRLLEVGCGIGTYTQHFARQGLAVTAVDVDRGFVEIAETRFAGLSNVEVRLEDATVDNGGEELWNSVVMLDVLEHLDNDDAVLRGLARRLVPQGQLVVKVPAHEWLRGSLDDAVGHYRRYSRRSLQAVFDAAGFEIERIDSFNLMATPGWFLNSRVMRRQVVAAGQIGWFERLVPLGQTIDRLDFLGLGVSLIAVGRKRD